MNHKRVQRIWRLEGLRVPKKQPKRARLWLSDGSCVRLRPQHKDHVWAYGFVHLSLPLIPSGLPSLKLQLPAG